MNGSLRGVCVLFVAVLTSCAASSMRPSSEAGAAPPLAVLIPERFGEWTAEPQPVAQVLLVPDALENPAAAQDASYDDVLMRTYRRVDGTRIMAAFAYGRRQTQEVKIHRPELCYYAQGFEVRSLGLRDVRLSTAVSIGVPTLVTQNRARTEIVTYWIRLGDQLASSAWDMRAQIFRDGLSGRVPDGLLVRASSLAASHADVGRELAHQESFLRDLYASVPAATQRFLAGSVGAAQ
jgi:EpsI family protein